MSSIVVIANPISGPSRRRLSPEQGLRRLEEMGHTPTLCLTGGPGHATELARDAAQSGADMVLAVGGDGTVHETALGLAGTSCVLAVMPSGSGNDFARGIGCPTLADGLRALRTGKDFPVDVGTLNGKLFFNSVGLLASGEVSGRADRIWRVLGNIRYRLAAVTALLAYKGQPVRWTLHGREGQTETRAGDYLFAEICNGPTTGGGFRFTPDAKLGDGLLDACLIKPVPLLTAFGLLPAAGSGKKLDHPAISVDQCTRLEFAVDRPVAYHLDGEPDILPAGSHTIALSDKTLIVRMNPEGVA